MTNKIRVGILGAGGRMGRMLIQATQDNPQTQLTATIDHKDSSLIGVDVGELVGIGKLDVVMVGELTEIIDNIDVLIDFSVPNSTVQAVQLCQQHKIPMVIGTTGLTDEQNAIIEQASKEISIVYAGNYSTGVNVSLKLIEIASKAFADTADVEIIEAHHKHKIDAPSGTAFMMAENANKALSVFMPFVAVKLLATIR